MAKSIKIGALISGGGSNLQAIIDSCESGNIDGTIAFVGSDNPEAKGLKKCVKHNIPAFTVDYRSIINNFKINPKKISLPSDFNLDEAISKNSLFPENADIEKIKIFLQSRAVAEAKLLENINPYKIDLLVLAGFMRNLTPYFIDKINTDPLKPGIMNIHPALLPSFPGVDGYGDTFRYGCKVGGCTVHFVDYGEDSGPIIGQKTFEITETDTIDTIKKKGLKLEWKLYPECIQLYAGGRLELVEHSYKTADNKTNKRIVVKISP